MKALKPYITKISEKYKDNDDMKNRVVGKLYEDADQNPLAGCLTSLLQLPIFLGLYRGVRLLAKDGKLDEPFLWIPTLAGPVSPPEYRGMDWLTEGWKFPEGGLPEPPMGWEATLPFLIMPVVLILLQSTTMKILSPQVDDNMSDEEKEQLEKSQGILKFLPLMIGFFSLQVPAGLTIYWATTNLFTLSQSLAVRAYYTANPPKIELPEYWDAALKGEADFDSMTPEERKQAAQAGIRIGPTMEDLEAEARFHTFIPRTALRSESTDIKSGSPIAAELEDWVKMGAASAVSSVPSPTSASNSTAQAQAA